MKKDRKNLRQYAYDLASQHIDEECDHEACIWAIQNIANKHPEIKEDWEWKYIEERDNMYHKHYKKMHKSIYNKLWDFLNKVEHNYIK